MEPRGEETDPGEGHKPRHRGAHSQADVWRRACASATADGVILDASHSWLDLARRAIDEHLPDCRIVDLSSAGVSSF